MRNDTRQPFFKFYDDYADNYLRFLSGDQTKELLMALVDYHRDGIAPEFSNPMLDMAFSVISGNIDRDQERYAEKCEKNRQNALARQEELRRLREKAYGDDSGY